MFFVYRIKAIRPKQVRLFDPELTKSEFLTQLIKSKPSREIRKGYIWHVGNVKNIGRHGIIFAIGRTTLSSQEKYDEESGDFVEVDDEESPFTYVFYAKKFGVLAIASKSKLAPTTRGIASNLERLLNADPYTKEMEIRIEISEIQDPQGFLDQLNTAYAVISFQMNFGEPNPFDVNKDFQAPMEKLLEETSGDKGATKISGQDLHKPTLEELSRSAASSGNNVIARLRTSKRSKPVTRHLKGNPASFAVDYEDIPKHSQDILSRLHDLYRQIRGPQD